MAGLRAVRTRSSPATRRRTLQWRAYAGYRPRSPATRSGVCGWRVYGRYARRSPATRRRTLQRRTYAGYRSRTPATRDVPQQWRAYARYTRRSPATRAGTPAMAGVRAVKAPLTRHPNRGPRGPWARGPACARRLCAVEVGRHRAKQRAPRRMRSRGPPVRLPRTARVTPWQRTPASTRGARASGCPVLRAAAAVRSARTAASSYAARQVSLTGQVHRSSPGPSIPSGAVPGFPWPVPSWRT